MSWHYSKQSCFSKNTGFSHKLRVISGGDSKDVKNPDASLRSRELVGLTILNDFVYEGKEFWSDGSIYDPKDGKTYSCKLTLKSADKLNLRGFIGFSMFGRTETWTRIE